MMSKRVDDKMAFFLWGIITALCRIKANNKYILKKCTSSSSGRVTLSSSSSSSSSESTKSDDDDDESLWGIITAL